MNHLRQLIRVYADTSVFGGVFDEEFSNHSQAFFELVKKGKFLLVTSPTLDTEIESAPEQVRAVYEEVLPHTEYVNLVSDIERLKKAYLRHNIVTSKWETDALHVASAVVGQCRIIVSWNFKHIVHFEKIPLYNAVNRIMGYNDIAIHTPLEVIGDG